MDYTIQLQQILNASKWSQEQLAAELGVSFPALNAWINKRAVPRAKAQVRIQQLHATIIGSLSISEDNLKVAKHEAGHYFLTANQVISNQEMLEKLTLNLTYHTNTIEGSTMTIGDVEDVIFNDKVLSNRTAIEQLEAKNHQSALYWLLDQVAGAKGIFLITEAIILGIHLRLMNGIVSDAGQYRQHAVRIMGTHVTLANWQSIPRLVTELTNNTEDPKDVVATLAKVHATFEKIHPFSDGNGRTGRLLMLAQALSVGTVPPIILKERKQAYYKYLELAQTKDNYIPLEYFIAQSIELAGKLLL
jgi:Fic family protein